MVSPRRLLCVLNADIPELSGVDLSETELEKARDKYPELEFHHIDAFDIGKLLALRNKHPFNKIFLDINGSRDVSAVSKLISIYADAWGKAGAGVIDTIVVKNCAFCCELLLTWPLLKWKSVLNPGHFN